MLELTVKTLAALESTRKEQNILEGDHRIKNGQFSVGHAETREQFSPVCLWVYFLNIGIFLTFKKI